MMVKKTVTRRFLSSHFGRNRSFDLTNDDEFNWSDPVPDASEGWIEFGTLKQLIFYPIDCSRGFKFQTGSCEKGGIELIAINNLDHDQRVSVRDRSYVLCRKRDNSAVLNPEESLIRKAELGASEAALISLCVHDSSEKNKFRKEVDYLGTKIGVYCGLKIGWHHLMFSIPFKDKSSQVYELALIDRLDKIRLSQMRRYKPEEGLCHDDKVDGCLPNFSSYTLINTRSYDAINSEKSKTYKYFRPQIVVDGKDGTEFLEDKIESVRIGNVVFGKVLPCVVPNANYNPDTKRELKFDEVYEYLMKNRLLHEKFPHLAQKSNVPVFGINMEVENYFISEMEASCSTNEKQLEMRKKIIKQGYKVYVKYRS